MRIPHARGGMRARAAAFGVAAGLVLSSSLVSAPIVAAANPAHPLPRVVPRPGLVATARQPLGLDTAPVTVVLQVSGDPVTVVQANQPDGSAPLNANQKNTIKNTLKALQNPIEQAVRSLGGQVVADYQSAYNGIRVRVPTSQLATLATLPNVIGVHRLALAKPSNLTSVPLIGAPQVWAGVPGYHGEGIKVAIIDSGIDYTHADFDGPGTVEAYNTEEAANAGTPNPAWFGPSAPRVKGGVDLVGDNYDADSTDATYQPVPHPDANPIDCGTGDGHGTHVAGTLAGGGVLTTGAPYVGPYDSTTYSNSFTIGPGVAPKADIYSIKVFGCVGSTDETLDGIEWAVNNNMDVINMSLGAPYGASDDPSAVAASNAAKAGVIVVASAGNEGQNPYMVGSPSIGNGVISVAGMDSNATFPGADFVLSGGLQLDAINANEATFSDGTQYTVKVITDNPATADVDESLGCSAAAFGGPLPANTIAVVNRGTCARVAKAIFGQQAGAAAVVMLNNAAELPPEEGPILSDPDDGTKFTVTIPFFGVAGPFTDPSSDSGKLALTNGQTLTVTNVQLANAGYLGTVSFSSAGPRSDDSAQKPDITAPGSAIFSAFVGTGTQGQFLSGTSMSSPHVAGVAALVKQAHPTWNKTVYFEAAIDNTGSPSALTDFTTRANGTGLVQAPAAVGTSAVAWTNNNGEVAVDFGFGELSANFNQTIPLHVKNLGSSPITFSLGLEHDAGPPHSLSLSPNVITLNGGQQRDVQVTLNVAAGTAGDSSQFNQVSGLITLTPQGHGNNGITLRVPYTMVPQATSNISSSLNLKQTAQQGKLTISNAANAVGAGSYDVYAWGLTDKKNGTGDSADLRAVGVQSFDVSGQDVTGAGPEPNGTSLIAFAISTQARASNAAQNEFDILVDVNGDGKDDYDIVTTDYEFITTGDYGGDDGVFVFDLKTGNSVQDFFADDPFNSSTLIAPVLSSALCQRQNACLSTSNPRFSYHVESFGWSGSTDAIPGSAKFNPYHPAISVGAFGVLKPGKSTTEQIVLSPIEGVLTPYQGLLIRTADNPAGAPEAQLISVPYRP